MASTIQIDIVTPEAVIFSDYVEFAVIPGVMGELGVMPKHCPLLTSLQPGEIRLKRAGEEISIFVAGGFCEILPDKITVLGDAAERAEEIDLERALEALHRAEELKKSNDDKLDLSVADAMLRESQIRLRIAEKKKKHRPAAVRHEE